MTKALKSFYFVTRSKRARRENLEFLCSRWADRNDLLFEFLADTLHAVLSSRLNQSVLVKNTIRNLGLIVREL